MKVRILNQFIKFFLFFSIFIVLSCDQKIEKRQTDQKINVLVFSSLTCPHCANFHKKVIVKIREDESLNNMVNFVHKGFPLDLAALNAEKILYCSKNQENRFELLTKIYDEQKNWASRGDINVINESLMSISVNFGLNKTTAKKCLKSEELEDKILQKVVDAQKNYKINSTPTIYINEKIYEGRHNYKSFKNEIIKLF